MSSLTGALFFLTAIAILLLSIRLLSKDDRTSSNAGVLGSLAFLTSIVALIAYLFRTPLLYEGEETAKMALTTAIAFFFLSSSVVALSGRKSIPLRYFIGTSTRAKLLRTFVPLSTIAVLFGSGASQILPALLGANPALVFALTAVAIMVLTALFASLISAGVSQEIDAANDELKESEKNLTERVKELGCLYRLSKTVETPRHHPG
ncbi:MAG TPA: hypothetical protein ENI11_06155 [Actinobacteria bacterium]|nr:hypothetical protein [Actinomycetota bacterium]